MPEKLDLLQGTLDLMVLETLNSMGPLHGYGIARRIEQVSGDAVRLQQRGLVSARWGVSDNQRRAKYYAIGASGRKRLAAQTEHWLRLADVMGRVLRGRVLAKGGAR